MRRVLIVLAFVVPALLLVYFSLRPAADAEFRAPLFHFYVVTFATFAAAVTAILFSTALEPAARPRHVLASVAFAIMGVLFFTHGLPTPGALTHTFHPALQWSAWLTLLGGSLMFLLAAFDGPETTPGWLRVRPIIAVAVAAVLVYLAIAAFAPHWLTAIDSLVQPWHQRAVFWATLVLWLVAAMRLRLAWRMTGRRVDGALAFVAFWLAQATISQHQFPLWQLSWWLYHFILLVAFLVTLYILAAEYEQARRFRLLPYYLAISLIVTALLALLASALLADFVEETLATQAVEQGGQVMASDPYQPVPQLQEGDPAILRARTMGLVIAALTMGLLFTSLLFVVGRADRIITGRTQELAIAYVDLRRSESIRQDLTNMVVHDLRGPLTAISAGLDLLARSIDRGDQARQSRFLGSTRNGVKRLSGLIDDIMTVSKMEAGELCPVFEATPLQQLLREHLEAFMALAASEDKRLGCECPDELQVELDRDLIGRTVENLVGNAFKYTNSGGLIQVSAGADNGQVRISVRDDGVGVPDEYKEVIFDKFAQVAKGDGRPERNGTGLGLAFCRLAIEAHGGRIWVEDAAGGGSAFVFLLPREQAR